MRRDDREIDTADFLRETGGQTLGEYQNKLERQADILRRIDGGSSDGDGPEPLYDGPSRYPAPQKSRDQDERDLYEEDVQSTGKYTKGYYDGYADALEELNEELEEDEYDFGRRYRGKSSKKRKKKPRVVYEYDDYDDEPVVVKRKKRKKRGHPFLAFLFFLFVLILIAGGFAASRLLARVNHIEPVADAAADDHAKAAGIALKSDPAVKNILLIGSDRRETQEDRQRSDSMILCSINSKRREIVLTSLMRDMYVPIPDHGSNKLNAAYSYGDVELLDETIQEDFGIDIDGNILVDFDSFIQALTAVGNIDIELSQEEADYMNSGGWEDQGEGSGNDGTWNLRAGVNSLTPAQSLAYCRIRYVGNSDWERTERQRRVVMAALSKFRHSDPLTQYRVLSNTLGSITTDMTDPALLMALARLALAGGGSINTYLIPVEGAYYADYIDDMAVLVPDLGQNSTYLKEYIYG